MDFGVVGFDGVMDSENGFLSLLPDVQIRGKDDGSGSNKQQRSDQDEANWRGVKLARADDLLTPNTMHFEQGNSSLQRSKSMFPDNQPKQQMLSFSSPKSDPFSLVGDGGLLERSLKNSTFSFSYPRTTGMSSSMHGVLSGGKGPFTPNQWLELEHQALIYKYMEANLRVPSNLLIPFTQNLNPNGLSGYGGSSRLNAMGWGSFPLGFAGNADPEVGRCRRTDGKKWRCSRDVVPDHKYCERHMNRGRHRSRKPVEDQTSRAGSGPATTKLMPMANNSSMMAGGGVSNGLYIAKNQVNSLQPGAAPLPLNPQINNRNMLKKDNMGSQIHESKGLSMLSRNVNLRPRDAPVAKHHNPFEESGRPEFGLVSSDSLLNPSESNSYINCHNFGPASDLTGPEPQDQLPYRHFMDDWPKNQSDQSAFSWPDVNEIQSDSTKLSISIPIASDFSTESSSPTHEKLGLSPLRLAREFDPIHMGLGVGNFLNEPTNRETSWNPISWGASMGGPLGEVLNNRNTITGEGKNPDLNLMTVGWDTSPGNGSSPTGVLQETTFGSLSNSSTGSSPRAETNQTRDKVTMCDDLLGSTLFNSSSIRTI